ncbi:MAG: glycosyltransferase family 4 protein [Chthoniobacterales bacterium]|nr:glycosyltransferase family 4 protein [Chthoniobacterales bacterium]
MSKKILVLCYEYPPLGGGGGRVAAQVASALQKRDHEVRVVTGGMRHLPKRTLIDGVEVIRVRSGRRGEESCTVFEMLSWVMTALPVALQEARSWKPDVMHVHFAVPTGAVAWLVHQLTRIPYILTVHLGDVPGGVPEQTELLFKFLKPLTIPIWQAATHVTAVSSFVAGLAEKAYGRRAEIIFNGIDYSAINSYKKNSEIPQLLMIGRLSVQKNPLLAIQALSLLSDLPWRLQIIGEGPLAEVVHRQVMRLTLQERVIFSGWLSAEKVKAAMEKSDILLMPSLSEGLPMAGIEALAHGLGIVGSHIGGLKDILIDRENGRFFTLEEGAKGMAAALRPLLEHPNLLKQAQEASRHLAQRFDWADSVEAYERLLINTPEKKDPQY